MKRMFAIIGVLTIWTTISAQPARIYRTEFKTYDTREDALNGDSSATSNYFDFAPSEVVDGYAMTELNLAASWGDYDAYFHVENAGSAYDVVVNDRIAASVESGLTPADFYISPYLVQGRNTIGLHLRETNIAELNTASRVEAKPFQNSYIFAQYRLHIEDYDLRLRADKNGDANLLLDIAVRNGFNVNEVAQVGYDIYAPDGKLLDYAVRELEVAPRSVDTLRVRVNLGSTSSRLWSETSPRLFRLTLYMKRSGKPREYIVAHGGVATPGYEQGVLTRDGRILTLRMKEYNVTAYDRKKCYSQIASLRKSGINTLMPTVPQPLWFYDICDEVGMYVMERPDLNPTDEGANNNPRLTDEYLTRVKSSYFRTRNHTCIIAYVLGDKTLANGYNLYKTYEWLKGVEPERAVVCLSAGGEWNTDIDSFR